MSPSGRRLTLCCSTTTSQTRFPSSLPLSLSVIPEGLSASYERRHWLRPQSQTRSGK